MVSKSRLLTLYYTMIELVIVRGRFKKPGHWQELAGLLNLYDKHCISKDVYQGGCIIWALHDPTVWLKFDFCHFLGLNGGVNLDHGWLLPGPHRSVLREAGLGGWFDRQCRGQSNGTMGDLHSELIRRRRQI